MRRTGMFLTLLGILFATVGAALATPNVSTTALTAKPASRRGQLPEAARELLRPWMANHRTDVNRLLNAVLLLKYRDVETVATALANDARLARPTPGSWESLNNAIPTQFYDLQDDFRAAARRLASSAHRQDDAAISADFGYLTQTCVNCHSVYLPVKQ